MFRFLQGFGLAALLVAGSATIMHAQDYSVIVGGGFYPQPQAFPVGTVSLAACTATVNADTEQPAAPGLCSYSTIETRGITSTQPQYQVRTGIAKLLQEGKRFSLYGLATGDLGKTFSQDGYTFKIVGLNTRRRRYPVVVERQPDGKRFKFGAEAIVRALGKKGE